MGKGKGMKSMFYGEVAKRKLPSTDEEKVMLVKEMISEVLEKNVTVFDTTTFIVHEIDGYLTVGMKWESE